MRQRTPSRGVAGRLARVDFAGVGRDLDALGHATIPGLVTGRECAGLIACYGRRERFWKHVDMARHRFGEGEYRYFARPLPEIVHALRRELYPPLAGIANRWMKALGERFTYPRTLDAFLARCAAHGQTDPTPLLLRYQAGGYNCLHQDLYGAVAFPLQVTVLLSEPEADFRGGEFLLVEQRARQQSRGDAIALRRGEAIVFPSSVRPVPSARGVARARTRHGVSRILEGERYTLGIIFHDAR